MKGSPTKQPSKKQKMSNGTSGGHSAKEEKLEPGEDDPLLKRLHTIVEHQEELLKKHPHWKWRVLKLQEQRAFCCAKLNDLDKAAEILSIFLREAENLSDEEAEYDVVNLNESVELLTKIIDEPEMLSRLKKIARRTEWEDFYQWETTF